MKGVLTLHKVYPANKRSLAGKQPKPSHYKTPLDIPSIRGKYKRDLNYDGEVVKSCVHCHQVTEAKRQMARLDTQPMPLQLIFLLSGPQYYRNLARPPTTSNGGECGREFLGFGRFPSRR